MLAAVMQETLPDAVELVTPSSRSSSVGDSLMHAGSGTVAAQPPAPGAAAAAGHAGTSSAVPLPFPSPAVATAAAAAGAEGPEAEPDLQSFTTRYLQFACEVRHTDV